MGNTPNPVKPTHTNSSSNIHIEILLLGNILRNPGLINDYTGVLFAEDFEDPTARYLYTVMQEYYAVYGNQKLSDGCLPLITFTLLEEKGLKYPPGLTTKNFADMVASIQRFGSDQPADSDAYRIVKRNSILRQLEDAHIDVQDIYEREDFSDLTADKVMSLIYERIDPLANAAALHPHEDFSSNITERALRFFEKPEIGLQTPFSFINEHMHGLCPNDFTLIGGLSNTGKDRACAR